MTTTLEQPHARYGDVIIRPATIFDVPAIQSLVEAAYTMYIERIGKRPAPMLTDYKALVQNQKKEVYVLELEPFVEGADDASPDTIPSQGQGQCQIVGSIVLDKSPPTGTPSLGINNVVVDPSHQGKGYGRLLIQWAESQARRLGKREMTLYTNIKMVENLGLYVKLGFQETGRKTEDGYERVFFSKSLSG